MPPKIIEWMIHRSITLLITSVAREVFFCPKKIEEIVAPPTAINVQNATTRFINGNVIANPEIAITPTPRPIKMLSIILYRDTATLATTAGTEYSISSFDIDWLPNSIGDDFGFAKDCIVKYLCYKVNMNK